jgi:hypothetical protein
MKQQYEDYYQNSCLHGGTNVTSLWKEGNGMHHKYNTSAALKPDGTYDFGAKSVKLLLEDRKWDFVIINDYTQQPCRKRTKQDSKRTLHKKYLPHIKDADATVVFLMTAAYEEPAKNSSDLGTFDEFTALLLAGYQEYARLFPKARIAPFGLAYQHIKRKYGKEKWLQLYAPDHFHPSPHGTYLAACVLYCTINGHDDTPPTYNKKWWNTSRIHDPPMPYPTNEEAEMLKTAAIETCTSFDTTDNAEYAGDDDFISVEEELLFTTEKKATLSLVLVIAGSTTLFVVLFKIHRKYCNKHESENIVEEPQSQQELHSLRDIS